MQWWGGVCQMSMSCLGILFPVHKCQQSEKWVGRAFTSHEKRSKCWSARGEGRWLPLDNNKDSVFDSWIKSFCNYEQWSIEIHKKRWQTLNRDWCLSRSISGVLAMVSTPQHRLSTTGNVDQQPLLHGQAPYLTSQVGVGGEPDYILDS